MKNISTRKIVNIDKVNPTPLWNYKQEDDGVLLISIYKSGQAFDVSSQEITLGVKNSKGQLIEHTEGIVISGSNIDITLKNSIFAVKGKIECELTLKDGDGKMSTATFYLLIGQKILGDDSIASSNMIPALDKLVTDFKERGDNTIDDITKDYCQLKETITSESPSANLQAQINDIKTGKMDKTDIVNDFTGGVTKVPSAESVKVLNETRLAHVPFNDNSIKVQIPGIREELDGINSSLDSMPKLNYNTTTIDSFKKRFEGMYINVLDFGADNTGATDSSVAFQQCIDYCYANNKIMFIPNGSYLVSSTIYLPSNVTIIGDNFVNDYYSSKVKKSCIINTNCDVVFKPVNTTATEVVLTIKNVFFKNIYNGTGTLFEGVNLRASLLYKLLIGAYDYVINGSLTHVSVIDKCHIYGIKKAFILGTLTDINISNCYINGKPEFNATCFDLSGITMSNITNNYIDFFKYAFNLSNYIQTSIIANNRIDYCFIGINAKTLNNLSICNNVFRYIRNSEVSKFPNADNDMTTTNWCCIKSINGVNRTNILGNLIIYCNEYLNVIGYACYEFNSRGNIFTDGVRNVVWSITKAGNDFGLANIYIEELENKTYTALPSAKLTGSGITSYPNQRIIYNNKILWNNAGAWYDFMGNAVTN